jgi:hypothetical protein
MDRNNDVILVSLQGSALVCWIHAPDAGMMGWGGGVGAGGELNPTFRSGKTDTKQASTFTK